MNEQKKSWLERKITLPVLAHPEAEKENYLTHAFGFYLAIIATIYLFFNWNDVATTASRVGLLIYCLSMILLYGASALYHKLPQGDSKRICRIFDHSNIYFLIAGTYTALLTAMGTQKMINITIIVWLIALAGVLFTLIFWGKLKPLHVVLYVAMGWMIVFFWKDIMTLIPQGMFFYIIAGGITYTLGVIFYGFKKIPHGHAIWHLFVLGGSIFFYIGFALYLM